VFSHLQGVTVIVTQYATEEELEEIFQKHSIHTVVSTVNPPTRAVHDAQLRLIRAAAKVDVVKRFVPSEYAIDYNMPDRFASSSSFFPYSVLTIHLSRLPLSWKSLKTEAIRELQAHSSAGTLSYTIFHCGYFLDYFAVPHTPSSLPPSYMIPEIPFVDIAAGKAAIPGDGDTPVTWTHTADVGRFVAKACADPADWCERSITIGASATFHSIVAVAEEITRRKFEVVYDSVEDLRAGKVSEIPAYKKLYDMFGSKEAVLEMFRAFGLAMALGDVDFEIAVREGRQGWGSVAVMNEKYPDVRPVSLRELVEKAWGRV